jgi:hypothetical protein
VTKTFEEYAAEYSREPFQWPMPKGVSSVAIPQPSFATERAAVAAAAETGSVMDAVVLYAGVEGGAKIREAWGALPSSALNAVMTDMRKHFGTKNS